MDDYRQCYIEETLPSEDGPRYRVLFRGTFDECWARLQRMRRKTRLEIWSKAWAETHHGYAPMAWKN